MEVKERFSGVQLRTLEIGDCSVRVLDEEERTVELSFSSETPVTRWGEDEILSHKKSAVLLDRINTTGCLLFNHNRDKVIGKIEKAKIENKRGTATVKFDTDAESDIYFNKVKSGSLRGVSVGYIIHEYKSTPAEKSASGRTTYTVTKWEPLEISIVSVPADTSVGVGRSMDDETNPQPRGGYRNYVDYQLKISQNLLKIKEAEKL